MSGLRQPPPCLHGRRRRTAAGELVVERGESLELDNHGADFCARLMCVIRCR